MTLFLSVLLRLDLDFADFMSPVSPNVDVQTGEGSKLKIFSTSRASFVS